MSFKGGYTFKRFEGAAKAVLKEVPVPKTVSLALHTAGLDFVAKVNEGDPVRAGIAVAGSAGENPVSLYAPVNGTVKSVTDQYIVIAGDGTTQFDNLKDHTRSPWQLEKNELFRQICETASIILIDPGIDSISRCDRIAKIIVNAVHNTPLNQSWKPDIPGAPYLFSSGLKILKTMFSNADVTIAANKRNARDFNSAEITGQAGVRIVSDKYPQEHPEMLSRDIAGERLTSPEGVRNETVLIVDADAVIQTAEIMTTGRPFIDRILMIAGPGVSQPAWYRVRIGTGMDQVKRDVMKSDEFGPWRIIRGDVMTGNSIGVDASILPTDTAISVIREQEARELFRFMMPGFAWDSYSKTSVAEVLPLMKKRLDSSAHGGERPCVQCNYCDEVCPVGIYPFLIWKYTEIKKADESFRLRPYDCIGCGLCDYVCPSKIHISDAVGKAADEYRESRRSDEDAD